MKLYLSCGRWYKFSHPRNTDGNFWQANIPISILRNNSQRSIFQFLLHSKQCLKLKIDSQEAWSHVLCIRRCTVWSWHSYIDFLSLTVAKRSPLSTDVLVWVVFVVGGMQCSRSVGKKLFFLCNSTYNLKWSHDHESTWVNNMLPIGGFWHLFRVFCQWW